MRILILVALATLANANTCLLQTKLELKSNNRRSSSRAEVVRNSTTSVTDSPVQSLESLVSASHQGVRDETKVLGNASHQGVRVGKFSELPQLSTESKVRDETKALGKFFQFLQLNAENKGFFPLPWQLVVLLYFAYTVPCVWYEMIGASANSSGKQRDGTIDFIRLVMHFLIIIEHVSMGPPFIHTVWCNWKMGVFSVLSGIFGSHVDKAHLANVLCYTLGSIIMLRLVLEPSIAILAGATEYNNIGSGKSGFPLWFLVRGPEWYLMALGIWRFCVSPFFALMKRLQVPALVPFIFTFGFSLLVKTQLPDGSIYSYVGAIVVLMPYFAIGLLRPASWWLEILHDRRLQLASAAFYVLWFGFILNHYQIEDAVGRLWVHPTVSKMTVSYILMASMCLATMQLLALVHTILQKCFPPQMMQIIDGLGARTFYGYILHYYITVNILVFLVAPHVNKAYLRYCDIPVKLLDERMDEEMLPPCFAGHCIAFAISVHAAFILCSRLTEKLFGWMLMPYWMKSVASFVCSCCGQSPKKDAETLADTRAGGEKMLDASRKI
mmetsp:Transcript_104824/g.190742  ORF Transcript_104824/g.190742 Transcript_104824/m.190742 type:complete len:554 (-) Transcript_104824:315-1976(-)